MYTMLYIVLSFAYNQYFAILDERIQLAKQF